jgi:uncharacterized RDD family membrane protein YckC
MALMHVEESARIVISEADLWRPIEDRSFALEHADRSGLRWRRFFASLVDSLLLAIPLAIVVALVGVFGGLVALAVLLSYDFLCESLFGQTVGKALLGIRVVRKDGGPLHLAAVATRNVLRLVENVLFIGPIMVLVTRGRQRLGDVVAGTVIARADGMAHIPSSERCRTQILVGYPAIWLVGAIIGVVIFTGQAKKNDYLALANFTCSQAKAALDANPNADIAEMHATVTDIERSLRQLTPPSSTAAAHQRLVDGVHRQRALLGQAAHLHGSEQVAALRKYCDDATRDSAQAKADGFPGCV